MWTGRDMEMIRLLVVKDWEVYQKQLAGYMTGLVLALSLIGTGKAWSFYAGALLLIVLLVAAGFFAIGHIVVNERKEQTLPFVMSLPVHALDVFLAKLIAGLVVYLVPFALVTGTTVLLVLGTGLPDGLLVYALLIYCFMLMSHTVALCVAIAVESEGWNIFVQMALMTALSPFILWTGGLEGIGTRVRTDEIVVNSQVMLLFGAELLVMVTAIAATCWQQQRKTSFLAQA